MLTHKLLTSLHAGAKALADAASAAQIIATNFMVDVSLLFRKGSKSRDHVILSGLNSVGKLIS